MSRSPLKSQGAGLPAASDTLQLRLPHVRALMRVIGEADELLRQGHACAAHLLGGVRRIIGATVGGFVTDCDFHPTGRGAQAAAVLDGWDGTTLPALQVLAREGSQFSPGIGAMMRACPATPGATLAATRQDLVDERGWYASAYVNDFLGKAHLDHALYSCTRGSTPSVVHGLGFHREKGERPFDDADRALIYLFQLECQRFFAPSPHRVDDLLWTSLSPRQRQTLELLLDGLADKEIAALLGISRHTVNQYTKSIYRRFAVHSRTSLIARLRRVVHSP